MGYHLRETKKGQLGQLSKIEEELDEAKEAAEQGNRILLLCELSDLYGALEAFCATLNVTIQDLEKMASRTKSAFMEGKRG